MAALRRKKRFPRHRRLKWGRVMLYVFMTAVAAFMAMPIIYLVSSAFKPIEELFVFPPRFFVQHPTTRNFVELLLAVSGSSVPFSRFAFNSVFVSSVTVLGSVVLSSMAAYPLAKHRFPGKDLIFLGIVSALMFAPEVTQIPRYLVVNKLGLIDTYGALIIPNLAGALGLFLTKQFLEQIPGVLLEAARVDGASEWTVFTKVIMPIIKPACATVAMLVFVASWNDTFSPLVFTRSEAMKTLPLAVQTIAGGPGVVARTGAVMAASFVLTMPTIVVFLLLQRLVLETMVHSGIKA
ncbi:MAG: carbohydrate ABC transporter permease [Bacillota bacterium]|nr:carbohydrate ABC transporter permease [Bacillota bacterium]